MVNPRGGRLPLLPSDECITLAGWRRTGRAMACRLEGLLDTLHPESSLKARISLAFGAAVLLLSMLLSLVVGWATLARLEQALETPLAELVPGLASALLGWVVVGIQLRPLASIAAVAERMRRGDRSATASTTRSDGWPARSTACCPSWPCTRPS